MAAKEAKVRILHEGRADVERVVPVVGKKGRGRVEQSPAG